MSKKFLIIKIGALGDIIMTLPILSYIKRNAPDAQIDWLCGMQGRCIIEATHLVDRMYTIDEHKLLWGHFFHKFRQVWKAWKQIAFHRYDYILLAHADRRYRFLSLFSIAKEKRFLSDNQNNEMIPGRYHGNEYIRILLYQQLERDELLIFPDIRQQVSPDMQQFIKQIPNAYVVMNPGGNPLTEPGKFLRMWPLEMYKKLALDLASHGIMTVLIGHCSDETNLQFFQGEHVINFVGKTGFIDLVFLFQKAKAVITHDSGPMHLAVWAKAHLIALFGPTRPSEKLPMHDPNYAQRIYCLWGGEQLKCRPCYDGRMYAPCRQPVCMHLIDRSKIVQKIIDWNGL
ncbi:MAG: glycosyltransferase family 9 protein [Simkaniaceae bacterium]|nr:glycosyltransferase family 9 protein [Simkaniaceae bacterium]